MTIPTGLQGLIARLAPAMPASAPAFRLPQGFDVHAFFHGANGVRRSLFPRGLLPAQVSGCERILSACVDMNERQTGRAAYFLATSFHETAQAMQPVKETQVGAQAVPSDREVVRRLDRAFAAGQLKWVRAPYWRPDADGKCWFGRGDVQLTHKVNYDKLAPFVRARFGVDIVADPGAVLRPDVSAFVMIEGMTRGDTGVSDFTSSALSEFIAPGRCDYEAARRTVNPGDRSSYALVAGYARAFAQALSGAGWPG